MLNRNWEPDLFCASECTNQINRLRNCNKGAEQSSWSTIKEEVIISLYFHIYIAILIFFSLSIYITCNFTYLLNILIYFLLYYYLTFDVLYKEKEIRSHIFYSSYFLVITMIEKKYTVIWSAALRTSSRCYPAPLTRYR